MELAAAEFLGPAFEDGDGVEGEVEGVGELVIGGSQSKEESSVRGGAADGHVGRVGEVSAQERSQRAGVEAIVKGDDGVIALFDVEEEVFAGVAGDAVEGGGKGEEAEGGGLDVCVEGVGGDVGFEGEDEGDVWRDFEVDGVKAGAEALNEIEAGEGGFKDDDAAGHGGILRRGLVVEEGELRVMRRRVWSKVCSSG